MYEGEELGSQALLDVFCDDDQLDIIGDILGKEIVDPDQISNLDSKQYKAICGSSKLKTEIKAYASFKLFELINSTIKCKEETPIKKWICSYFELNPKVAENFITFYTKNIHKIEYLLPILLAEESIKKSIIANKDYLFGEEFVQKLVEFQNIDRYGLATSEAEKIVTKIHKLSSEIIDLLVEKAQAVSYLVKKPIALLGKLLLHKHDKLFSFILKQYSNKDTTLNLSKLDKFVKSELAEVGSSKNLSHSEHYLKSLSECLAAKSLLEIYDPIKPYEAKSLDQILDELEKLNKKQKNTKHIDFKQLDYQYRDIFKCFDSNSKVVKKFSKIKDWKGDEIREWSKLVKNKKLLDKFVARSELLAVLIQANIVFCKQLPRIPQILSLIMLLDSSDSKGLVLQIHTGEGKSLVTAMLAAAKVLAGHDVDIITSSKILAERDFKARERFFDILGISSSCNNLQNHDYGKKKCYNSNVVFSDVANFQYDWINHEYYGKNTRGSRKYDTVIVDEVDSMLIDESSRVAMIGNHIAGFEYLKPLYVGLWNELQWLNKMLVFDEINHLWYFDPGRVGNSDINPEFYKIDNEIGKKLTIGDLYNFKYSHLLQYLKKIVSNDQKSYKIPSHLKQFVNNQLDGWVKSVLVASNLSLGKDYLIVKSLGNIDGVKNSESNENQYTRFYKIAPVDYHNTGVINPNLSWSNGIHQFLQIKHGLKISPETISPAFISNMSYFKKYGKNIYGLTGTLGLVKSQELLQGIYGVDLALLPTFKVKKLKKEQEIICDDNSSWVSSITSKIRDVNDQGRATLVIAKTIKDAKYIYNSLIKNYDKSRVRLYTKGDKQEEQIVGKVVKSGDVIIATNLAGRGTDIAISKNVQKSGGLHVCISFLPANKRVEDQAIGRTARQGAEGSAQIIASIDDVSEVIGIGNISDTDFKLISKLRKFVEQQRIFNAKIYDADKLDLEDTLFGKFTTLSKFLKSKKLAKNYLPQKISQLEEKWAIWRHSGGELLKNISDKIFKEQSQYLQKIGFWQKKIETGPYGLFKSISSLLGNKFSPAIIKLLAAIGISKELKSVDDKSSSNSEHFSDDKIIKAIEKTLLIQVVTIDEKGKNTIKKDCQNKIGINNKNISSFKKIYLGSRKIGDSDFNSYIPLLPLSRTEMQKREFAINSDKFLTGKCLSLIENSVDDPVIEKIINQLNTKESKLSYHFNKIKADIYSKQFKKFRHNVILQYKDGNKILSNPAYASAIAIDKINSKKPSYKEFIKYFDLAISLDPYYSYVGYYNKSHTLIKHYLQSDQEKRDKYKNDLIIAKECLIKAKHSIDNTLRPQLESVSIISGNFSSEMSEQTLNKIYLLKICSEYISNLIKIIDNNSNIDIKRFLSGEKFFADFFDNNKLPQQEILELQNSGILKFFDLGKQNYYASKLDRKLLLEGFNIVHNVICAGHDLNSRSDLMIKFISSKYSQLIKNKGLSPNLIINYITTKSLDHVVNIGTSGAGILFGSYKIDSNRLVLNGKYCDSGLESFTKLYGLFSENKMKSPKYPYFSDIEDNNSEDRNSGISSNNLGNYRILNNPLFKNNSSDTEEFKVLARLFDKNPKTALEKASLISKTKILSSNICSKIAEKLSTNFFHKSFDSKDKYIAIKLIDSSLKKSQQLLRESDARLIRLYTDPIGVHFVKYHKHEKRTQELAKILSNHEGIKAYLAAIELLINNGSMPCHYYKNGNNQLSKVLIILSEEVKNEFIKATAEKLREKHKDYYVCNIESEYSSSLKSDLNLKIDIKKTEELKEKAYISAEALSVMSASYKDEKLKEDIVKWHAYTLLYCLRKNIFTEQINKNLNSNIFSDNKKQREQKLQKFKFDLGKIITRSEDQQLSYDLSKLALDKIDNLPALVIVQIILRLEISDIKKAIALLNSLIASVRKRKSDVRYVISKEVRSKLSFFKSHSNKTIRNIVSTLENGLKIKFPYDGKINQQQQSSKIKNKILDKKEKPLTELIKELSSSNNKKLFVSKFINKSEVQLKLIRNCFDSDSKILPQKRKISQYSKEQLTKLALHLKKHKLSINNRNHLSETIAVMMRAVELSHGYLPRNTQLLSLLLLLDCSNNNDKKVDKNANKGRLLEIKTGEGKSVITAMLAAASALLCKNTVDIVTSSAPLARRDAGNQSMFFNLLGLSVGHNCYLQSSKFKVCYKSDIVYGDPLSFQADLLRDEFKRSGIKSDGNFTRKLDMVIIDEVDSMLIDEAGKIAKLASPISGMEYLQTLFISIALYIESMKLSPDKLTETKYFNQILSVVEQIISKIINSHNSIVIAPKFLRPFIKRQSKLWGRSALLAYRMKENVDYVISSRNSLADGKEYKVIAPVDHRSTGVVRTNTSWSRGLHQFLQIKHRLRFSSETLTTNMISNISYFKRYNKISGLTGTLGSSAEKSLLKSIYAIDTAKIPTFRKKQFKELKGIITYSKKEQIIEIAKSSINNAKLGRSVLVICPSIKMGLEIIGLLKKQYQGKIIQYLRSDDGSGNFSGKMTSGDIIVATNLAGRGTDIITDEKVEKAGGLHVITAFLAENVRVEQQAMGRTSRQGKKGTAQIIINATKEAKKYNIKLTREDIINGKFSLKNLKNLRDVFEQERLKNIKKVTVKKILFEDRLFDRFNKEIYQPSKSFQDKKEKLLQLEDLWGFWLNNNISGNPLLKSEQGRKKLGKKFELFKKEMISKYKGSDYGIMENPAYMENMVRNRLGIDSFYDEPMRILGNIGSFGKYYSWQLHYLRAFSHLRHNAALSGSRNKTKQDRNNSTVGALKSLRTGYGQISQVVLPQMRSALMQLSVKDSNTPLCKQLKNKIHILQALENNLKNNADYIAKRLGSGDEYVKIGNVEFFQDIFKEGIDVQDIWEFGNFGTSYIFNASAKKYDKDHASGAIVAIIGIAQIVVGAMVAIGSAGFAANFGVGLATSGAMDLINGMRATIDGEEIDLGKWFESKGIDIAVNLAMAAITTGMSASPKAGNATNAGNKLDKVTKATKISKSAQSVASGSANNAAKVVVVQKVVEESAEKIFLQQFGKSLGRRLITTQLTKVISKHGQRLASNAIRAEIKRLRAAIKNVFRSGIVSQQIELICQIDELLGTQNYSRSFEREALSVIEQKQDRFASIAQTLLQTIMETSASNRGNFILAGAIGVGSTALTVSKGVEQVRELRSYILSNIRSSASKVSGNLPGFASNLAQGSRVIILEEAKIIEKRLRTQGILFDRMKVNEDKINEANVVKGYRANQKNTEIKRLLVRIAEINRINYDTKKEELADRIADVTEGAMRGMIRSGIISPVSSHLVSESYDLTMKWVKKEVANLEHKARMEGFIKQEKEDVQKPQQEKQSNLQPTQTDKPSPNVKNNNSRANAANDNNKNHELINKTRDNAGLSIVSNKNDNIVVDEYVKSDKIPESKKIREQAKNVKLLTEKIKNGRLSDEELIEKTKELRSSMKYLLSGMTFLDKKEQALIKEYNARIAPENIKKNSIEAVKLLTPNPILAIIQKKTGIKLLDKFLEPDLLGQKIFGSSKISKIGKNVTSDNIKTVPGINSTVKESIEKNIVNKSRIKPKNSTETRQFEKLYPGLESWQQLDHYVKKVPSKYGKHINADRGVGVKWKFNEGGKKYEVRIDKAQPKSQFKSQQKDHVAITINRKVVDKTGENYILYENQGGYIYKIKKSDSDFGRTGEKYRFDIQKNPESRQPARHDDAHIPIEDWLGWKDIFKPE